MSVIDTHKRNFYYFDPNMNLKFVAMYENDDFGITEQVLLDY